MRIRMYREIPHRWVRLGAMLTSGLLLELCAGLALPAQTPPASAFTLSSFQAEAPPAVRASNGSSESVAAGQTPKGLTPEAWTQIKAQVEAQLTVTQGVALHESANGSFGDVLAIDGDTLVVGAPFANTSRGEVFIFARDQGGVGTWGLVTTVIDPASPSSAADEFGSSVAVHGDTVVISGTATINGAFAPILYIYEHSTGRPSWSLAYSYRVSTSVDTVAVYGNTVAAGNSAGNVVVLDRNAGGNAAWGVVNLLTGASADRYGCSVAINGDTMVVGAYGANNGSGAAYVYYLDPGTASWTYAATLSNSSGSEFGFSVAVNGDTVVVGSRGSGQVYIYDRNQGGVSGSWGLAKTVTDPNANLRDFFGTAVAVDGDFIVVGSPGSNGTGSAYAFARNRGGAGAWGLAATVNVSSGGNLGESIALSGDTWAIGTYGSDESYVYDLSGGFTNTALTIADPNSVGGDEFGTAVALSADTLVVGAFRANGFRGLAYVFERDQGGAGAWGLTATLSEPSPIVNDSFGNAVSVDGDTIAVAAYGANTNVGTVYVYGRNKNSRGGWGLVQSLAGSTANERFGFAVAVNGSTLAIGASGPSLAFIYEYNVSGSSAGTWTLFATLSDPLSGNTYGTALALYGDTLVVGDPGYSQEGAVHFYNRNHGGVENWGLAYTAVNPTAALGDEFGASVAIDGNTAIIGARGYNSDQGRVYVYEYNDSVPSWILSATVTDPAATANDLFGNRVAVYGDAIVAGSQGYSPTGKTNIGAAYLFNRNQGGNNAWGLTSTFNDPSSASGDLYGQSVAINGETVVTGTSVKRDVYLFNTQQPTATKDASIVWQNTNGQAVLWNMNGATIASAPNLGTAPAGWNIAGAADFNGDGYPDLIWRNTNGDTVIWFTDGSTVTSSVNLGIIPATWTVAGTGDFNGDGNADLLWRNSNGDTVVWFMSGGGITSSSDLGTIPASWSIAGTGDFNGDGKADILWRNTSGDTVIWFMNGGTITSSIDSAVVPTAWSVAGIGDFNGDGHRDILWRNSSGEVVIWIMNPDGTISSSADLGTLPAAWTTAGTGDFTGTGRDDILWRNSNGDTVIWFMNGSAIGSSADLGTVPTSWSIAGVAY